MTTYADLTEAERRTLLTLSDGLIHRGSRSANGDSVLGGPAAHLVRLGLAFRSVSNANRLAKTHYAITREGRQVLDAEALRLGSHFGGSR